MSLQPDKAMLHDLKNQLGIVVGFAELLLEEMDSVDAKRPDIEEIHMAGQRALALLSDLERSATGD